MPSKKVFFSQWVNTSELMLFWKDLPVTERSRSARGMTHACLLRPANEELFQFYHWCDTRQSDLRNLFSWGHMAPDPHAVKWSIPEPISLTDGQTLINHYTITISTPKESPPWAKNLAPDPMLLYE